MGAGLPLAGKRVLVTRAADQAGTLVAGIAELGGEPLIFPVVRTVDPEDWGPLDAALRDIASYRWLVVTSANAVPRLLERLRLQGQDVSPLAHLWVAAVGSATAAALAEAGVGVDFIPKASRGAALPVEMADQLVPGERILLPRADIADPAVADGFTALGCLVSDVVAYRTVPATADAGPVLARLAAGEVDYVTLTSGSTARALVAALGGAAPLAGVRVAAIGPETRKAAEAAGLTVHLVAAQPAVADLLAALAEDARGG